MASGKKIVKELKSFLAGVKAGKPVKQTMMRRMTVKGRTVYTRETYHAPLNPPKDQP